MHVINVQLSTLGKISALKEKKLFQYATIIKRFATANTLGKDLCDQSTKIKTFLLTLSLHITK